MARISTQATKIQIFDLYWQLFPYLLTVIMSFLYLITSFSPYPFAYEYGDAPFIFSLKMSSVFYPRNSGSCSILQY